MLYIVGGLVWSKRIDGGDNDFCYRVIADSGNAIIGGSFGNSVYISKLSGSTGDHVWQFLFAFPGTGRSSIKDLLMDPYDSTLVGVGSVYPYSGDEQACGYIVRLLNGSQVWWYIDSVAGCSRRYGFSGLIINGSLYYAYGTDYENYSTSWFGSSRRFMVSIDRTTGSNLWRYEPGGYTYVSATMNTDTTVALAGFGARGEVQVINLGGSEIWSYTDPSSSRYYDISKGNNGHPIVAGFSSNGRANEDFFVAQFQKETGGMRWAYFKNGGGNSIDKAFKVVVDIYGNTYAAGYLNNGVSGLDGYVVKLDSLGRLVWEYFYNGPGNSDDVFNGLKFSYDGNVLVYGFSTGMGTSKDMVVVKLNAATGDTMWVFNYNSPYSYDDEVWDVAVYGGEIYVCGYSYSLPTNRDILVLKISDPQSVKTFSQDKGNCRTEVYDVLGRFVGFYGGKIKPGIWFLKCGNKIRKVIGR